MAASYSFKSPSLQIPGQSSAGPSTPRHPWTSPPLSTPTHGPPRSPRLQSSPVLLHPLPPSKVLERESRAQSELELDRQIRQRQQERELAEALQDQEWEIQRAAARLDPNGLSIFRNGSGKGKSVDLETKPFARPPQAYELYQAIDKHDIDFIMRVRDHAFPLLLQKSAGEFPIVYAARLGDKHRDVVILLIGALSRYVNHLDKEDFEKKEIKNTLKALRGNLKLAIDNALLPGYSPTLLSSYLQVLIMSEGDAFLHKSTYEISLLLRDPEGSPVKAAEQLVRQFCTKELRGVQGGIHDVEEYVANAALDLVIMATWSLAAQQLDVDPLPTHTFARDLRTYQEMVEATEVNRSKMVKCTKRVRHLLDVLQDLGGDTKKGVQGRLKDVEKALDAGMR
ncbi:hypothetical protein M231_00956 [Tremella mesenterica]|uniref:Uncharacterized protein n=1 Tax=Tremella mesenterica TaxID=5217 RepID=A0A4Q1BUE0_TREME|nr:hypothetical protein M231_00956 [Tremella mesenterica]